MNKVLDLIHIKIHALRMLKDTYKPSIFEQEINKIIAEAAGLSGNTRRAKNDRKLTPIKAN